jgi:hypothetical protein
MTTPSHSPINASILGEGFYHQILTNSGLLIDMAIGTKAKANR